SVFDELARARAEALDSDRLWQGLTRRERGAVEDLSTGLRSYDDDLRAVQRSLAGAEAALADCLKVAREELDDTRTAAAVERMDGLAKVEQSASAARAAVAALRRDESGRPGYLTF